MSRARYHLVGVGGVGMSALAEVLAFGGARVSGSDRAMDQGLDVPVFGPLRAAGVHLVPQDGSGVRPDLDAVVFSSAVEEGNPDRAAARALGVPLRHRAEVLAAQAQGGRLLAVAGTSGKTTVTGMLGWALEAAGLDPWVVNGGALLGWRSPRRTGHTRCGASDIWVVETDESDRSLMAFTPEWAVFTTVSADHFQREETVTLFRGFAARVRKDRIAMRRVCAELGGRGWRPADPRGFRPALTPGGSRFRFAGLTFEIPMPGLHNAWNARLAVEACRALGCDMARVRDALACFPGIHRRLETVCAGPVRILDDMAHNPEKIRAAWTAAAREGGRILAVWRPHGFGPLRQMHTDLNAAFAELCRPEDRLFLLPVYYAGGTAQATVTSADLADSLSHRDVPVRTVRGYNDLARRLAGCARPGDTVLIMGARDPELPVFARRLAARLREQGESAPAPGTAVRRAKGSG